MQISGSVCTSGYMRSRCFYAADTNHCRISRHFSSHEPLCPDRQSGRKGHDMETRNDAAINYGREVQKGIAARDARAGAKTASKDTAPIDHSKDVLVSNDATFAELLRRLMKSPAASASARFEAREHEMQEKVRKLRESLDEEFDKTSEESAGEDFCDEYEEMSKEASSSMPNVHEDDPEYTRQSVKKAAHRPGAVQLRNNVPRIAMIDLGGGRIEVFANGYSIYDDGNRKVVLWVPDCGAVTYNFTPLRESEKEYQSQTSRISEDDMGKLPWYFAIMIAGENRITANLDYPKSVGSTSDFDFDDDKPSCRWIGCSHFDGPEEAYLKKEAARERRKALTESQQVIYEKYYEEGYSKSEVGKFLGIDESSARERIRRIQKRLRKDPENYFVYSE